MGLTVVPGNMIQDGTVTSTDMAVDPRNASNFNSGEVPTAQLGNVPPRSITQQEDELAVLAFKIAANGSLGKYDLLDQTVDAFEDASGVDASASTNEIINSSGYVSGTRLPEAEVEFTYTGAAQTYTVPAGKTSLVFKAWGPGGGGDSSDEIGGGGGFAGATIPVTAAETLHITVGGGGSRGLYGGSAGGGGGYSGIFRSSVTQGNALLIAGGGGGAGDRGTGGNGGGTSGTQGSPSTGGGGAGTDSAGGAAGSPANGSPTAGGALTGGNGGQPGGSGPSPGGFGGGGYGGSEPGGSMGGGGGGSGYYGGGGGSGAMPSGGTGGGGSGFSATPNTGTTLTAGSGQTGANQSDPDYSPGTGDGGNGGVDGEHGYVVIPAITAVYNNMTLVSTSTTASSAPTKGDMVMTYTDGAGTAVINTDITAEFSADNGVTYTSMTLTSIGESAGHKIISAHDVTRTSTSGTSMRYRIKTLNQSVSKQTRIQGVSLGWS